MLMGGIQGWMRLPGTEQPPKEKGRYAMTNIQNISAAAYGVQAFEPSQKGEAKKSAPPKSPAVKQEQVELSDASISLKKVKDAVDALPDVRIAKVEEIKQRIKYNGYPIETSMYKAVEKLVANQIV
jgi:flagellar biosynthesis anti-sigma factor FlgM